MDSQAYQYRNTDFSALQFPDTSLDDAAPTMNLPDTQGGPALGGKRESRAFFSAKAPAGSSEGSRLGKGRRAGPLSQESAARATTLLEDVYRSIPHHPEVARAAAVRLVDLLTMEVAGSARMQGGLAPWQKRKVEHYLKEHLDSPLRLETLAEQVSLSVSHFCRAFKESFGTTPHMLIIRMRLELARRLMLATQDPLSQIALACGLADQAHLSKLFRGQMGDSPSAWRRRTLAEVKAGTSRRAPPSETPWLEL
ncbi:helix-turn-helix domain-containing protein [Mesorhizobium sp. A556]